MLLNIFNNFFFFKKNNHFKKKIPYYIIKKIKGKKLINLKYLQIIKWIKIKKNKLKIYNADFVTDKEGTGIVHISPTFGINDNLLSIKKKIPSIMYKYKQKKISIVNNKGKYIKFLPIKFRNRYIDKSFIKNNNKKKKYLSLNDDIINFLIKKNKIFKIFYIKHKYPYC
ncbi:MAG: hypothetical protein ABUS76_00865 [Candidatus Shikimatogenerans sp. Ttur]|uniref:Aminoacyl-tRNA synthetase class Ia domain-containing protein n=1 Tax=Candidatus Shikimatogenerans sp. Ttur TaxID=3158569 RepID=A0AAU7ZXH3_9FLAO